MPKASRLHHADEFGEQPGRKGLSGFDPPMIGAASTIFVDGMTERESGQTPPPPPISVATLAIGFVVMAVVGLAILFVVLPRVGV